MNAMTKPASRPAALDRNSDSQRIVGYLKEVIQARGLRYRDLAALVGVSEKSIKRYLNGRSLSLAVLERLCDAVGIGLCELANLAGADQGGQPARTTEAQEDALAADLRMAIVLTLLTMGWTAGRIVGEGLAGEAQLTALLVRLDRLGLITLYPGNRTRVRAIPRPFDTCSPAFRRVISDAGARVIRSLDLSDNKTLWRLNWARLGPDSADRARKRLEAFVGEIDELSRQDLDLGGDHAKWYAVCGLVAEHEILGLKMMRDVEAPSEGD
jgi:transcriptional regulator with XRE-family HTH domain